MFTNEVIMMLEITETRPEKMRVVKNTLPSGRVIYTVEIYSTAINDWINQAEHVNEFDALQDCINWYVN